MSSSAPRWQDWLPARPSVNAIERLRAAGGALIGILLRGLLGAWMVGMDSPALWLMASMGASAVLLFAVPSSPLAQPWSIVGGNLLAVSIGVTCARHIDLPVLAAAGAVSLAIAAMFVLRGLHPPSGAVALMAVLGGPVVHAAGYRLVWAPVLVNSLCLLVIAVAYNRLTGCRYPHPQQVEAPGKALAGARGLGRPGFNSANNVPADASIAALVPLMSHHGWQHVPVVDSDRRLVGMVTQDDLVAALFDASLAEPGARTAARAHVPGPPPHERSDRERLRQPAA